MSIASSGMLARFFSKRKKSRFVWNIFFGIVLAAILYMIFLLIYQVLCDYVCYQTKQIYIECKDGDIITDSTTFEIVENDRQKINVNALIQTVDSGEEINLTISHFTGELLEVTKGDRSVYKVERTSKTTVLAFGLLFAPMLFFVIFMLISINVKNPGKRMRKIQEQILKDA